MALFPSSFTFAGLGELTALSNTRSAIRSAETVRHLSKANREAVTQTNIPMIAYCQPSEAAAIICSRAYNVQARSDSILVGSWYEISLDIVYQ